MPIHSSLEKIYIVFFGKITKKKITKEEALLRKLEVQYMVLDIKVTPLKKYSLRIDCRSG